MKASSVTTTRAAKKERPDLEEAIEESDEGEDAMLLGEAIKQEPEDEEDMDLTKDKYVKQAKKKAAPKNAATKKAPAKKKAKGKGKAKAEEFDEDEDDIDDEEEEEVKPRWGGGLNRKHAGRKGRGPK
jgi:replication factor C subunit 1